MRPISKPAAVMPTHQFSSLLELVGRQMHPHIGVRRRINELTVPPRRILQETGCLLDPPLDIVANSFQGRRGASSGRTHRGQKFSYRLIDVAPRHPQSGNHVCLMLK
jgi:hypothetical protein